MRVFLNPIRNFRLDGRSQHSLRSLTKNLRHYVRRWTAFQRTVAVVGSCMVVYSWEKCASHKTNFTQSTPSFSSTLHPQLSVISQAVIQWLFQLIKHCAKPRAIWKPGNWPRQKPFIKKSYPTSPKIQKLYKGIKSWSWGSPHQPPNHRKNKFKSWSAFITSNSLKRFCQRSNQWLGCFPKP